MTGILAVLVFIQQYVVPVLFALGIVSFFYGAIHSFVLDVSEIGNPELVRSMAIFIIGLIVYGAVAGLIMMTTGFTSSSGSDGSSNDRRGVDVERERSVLPVPNVPGQ